MHRQLRCKTLRRGGQRAQHAQRNEREQRAPAQHAPAGGGLSLELRGERREDADRREEIIRRVVHGGEKPVAEHGVFAAAGEAYRVRPRAVQLHAANGERRDDEARHRHGEHGHHAAQTEPGAHRDERNGPGAAEPRGHAEHLLEQRADPGGHNAHDAEQQQRGECADRRAQPRNVRPDEQRVHRLDSRARGQPQQHETHAAEQRERGGQPRQPHAAERAEILPQLLPGHIPRAEKAARERQRQPRAADFPFHSATPPKHKVTAILYPHRAGIATAPR